MVADVVDFTSRHIVWISIVVCLVVAIISQEMLIGHWRRRAEAAENKLTNPQPNVRSNREADRDYYFGGYI